jgi:lipoate-protein ligase A
MAIDTWLLDQHCQGLQPPALRFYSWQPAAISLGYHQHQYPAAWDELSDRGVSLDIVRRPTGGRAVLHQGDLTYAVVTSGLSGTRSQIYRFLCQFLIDGWRSLGVNLDYGSSQRGYIHNPNCFGTATAADLVTENGGKLIGSAQLRRGKAILQHGSMVLNRDRALYERIFNESPQLPLLPAIAASDAFIPTLIAALTTAAATCFNVEFAIKPLSDSELDAIARASE